MTEESSRLKQAEASREKLLAAALALFGEHGYSATGVRSINRLAGVADGLLYHYFPQGKKEIFQALIQNQAQELMEEVKRCWPDLSRLPLTEFLDQFWQMCLTHTQAQQQLAVILVKEWRNMEEDFRRQLERFFRQIYAWLPGELKKRAAAGEIRTMDFQSAAYSVLAPVLEHYLLLACNYDGGFLSSPRRRRQLNEYFVALWRKEGAQPKGPGPDVGKS
ncbi:MAG: TetR/AcrR family transcriptional regulator [Firmicutes bacterium]|nr:TetR/AcrR family transcriptional regulator [Bacillota bacterium]